MEELFSTFSLFSALCLVIYVNLILNSSLNNFAKTMNKFILLSINILLTSFFFAQQPTQQWLSNYNGTGDFSDKFNCIQVDNSGNIYAAGYTINSGSRRDFLTVKMNSAGDTLWTKTYNGTDNNDDEISALAIDLSGNVYVTGTAKGSTSDDDYVSIKYNSSGVQQWIATYNHTTNQEDQANSIAVDASGNVFVAGQSDGDATAAVDEDYATVKYNSSGIQQWVMRYDNNAATDRAVKVLAGISGNIYVTGRSDNGTDDDFITIKYSTSGTVVWMSTFDNGDNDKADAMTIDAAENIYVTGRSNDGTYDDILTIKYNSSGAEQWVGGVLFDGTGQNDDRPYAITVDGSGNVYVTGKCDIDNTTGVNNNIITIKYNASGTEQWTANYAGAGNGNDAPTGIVVDGSGKVIVCGQYDDDISPSFANNNSVTICYTSSGSQSWAKTYAGTSNLSDGAEAIAVDLSGNIFVAGNSDNTNTQKDGLVIAYTTSGTETFVKNYNGKGDNSDNVSKIVLDAADNSYIAGYTYAQDAEKDIFVRKIDPFGTVLWTYTYNGSDKGMDEALDIKVDASGNVYFTGYSKETTTGYDISTYKLNSTGTLLWNTKYNYTAANGSDKGVALTIDGSGNVYVTGSSDGNASLLINSPDIVTIKYSYAGIQQWATRYAGSAGLDDEPNAIQIDGSGNVYVTGKSSNGLDNDYITLKYNSSGVQQWAKIFNGTQGDDKAVAIELDASNNVIVTGTSYNGTYDDFVTVKYNNAGTEQWNTPHTGTNGDNKAVAMAIDVLGNIYVTGSSSNGMTDDITTIKYSAAGDEEWLMDFDGTATGNDQPTDIKIDDIGRIIVVGETNNGSLATPNVDFVLLKYHYDGGAIWEQTYDGPDQLIDGINTLAIGSGDNLFVSGNSAYTDEQKNIVTIKYDSPVGLNELDNSYSNVSLFPNPFTTSATVILEKELLSKNVSFHLFDLFGKEVKTITDIQNPELNITRDNLSNGMYTFKLIRGDNTVSTGKLILQ